MIFYKNKPIIAALLIVNLFSSCVETQKHEKQDSAKDSVITNTSALSLSAEQMNTVGIVVGPIEQKNLDDVVKASGQLAVPPQNKADVSILSGGIIRKISVLEGQHVQKGQLLVSIENQELLKLQQDYLTAKNNFSYVKAEYERQQELKDAGAGTGKSYQSAMAIFNAERSRISAFESQLQQFGISTKKIAAGKVVSQFPVVSPISGTVGQITANTGAYVQPGTAIMEVVDNSKIHCDLIVFEKDLMKVSVGQKVNFELTNQENQKISGTINGVNKSFENESKGVIVHAVIDNSTQKNLIPGMYVTALISVGTQLSPAVPVDAIVRSEGKEYVFTVNGKTKDGQLQFKKAEVKTGVAELGYIQITPVDQLPQNVQLVIKGAFYLQSKASGGAEE